tara:strand:- start:392 stop:1555 length:1164 start_codon:yes stop_codon:yes gene_type:complete
MSEIRVNSIVNESNTGGPVLSGITTFSGQQYFIPPTGTTAQRPSGCPPGSIRFNTDSAHLEYWNGLVWLEFEASSVELGNQLVTNSAGGTGTRGLIAGGYAPASPTITDRIEYITISTLGNTQDFGDLTAPTRLSGACASSTRGLFGGGGTPNKTAKIDFTNIATTGQTAGDFGNLITSRNQLAGCSNSIRGLFSGGDAPSAITDVIEHVTIATTGTCDDFGNLIVATEQPTACANSIRGLIGGGHNGSANTNVIAYVTISSTGDAQDFGDLTVARTFFGSCSNSIRGLFGAGYSSSNLNSIDFVTISSTGNAADFGDLTVARRAGQAACSSPTRGVFAGGQGGPSDAFLNVIDCIEILSTGNAVDFGDLIGTTTQNFACSNGHGGL